MTMNTVSDALAQPDRIALIERSRALHQIAERHFHDLTPFLSPVHTRQQAERLARLRPPSSGSTERDVFNLELASWTAEEGRRTALERYARQARLLEGSDEAAVLAGMQANVISVWAVEEEHPVAGWIVSDLINEGTAWVVDDTLGQYLALGESSCFIGRIFRTEQAGFWMTCGTLFAVSDEVAMLELRREGGEDMILSGSPEHVASSRDSTRVTFLYAGILPLD